MSTEAQGPFKGLRPFDDSDLDARLFFGRERDREVITANLLAARLTVLYGPSGVGKSSVLCAGVARQLRELPEKPLVVVFSSWAEAPARALAATIAVAAGVEEGGSLVETVEAAARRHDEVFVILDQAEELFLYDQDGFVEEFPELVNEPNLPVNVLVSVRDDSLSRLDVFKARLPDVLGNYLRLDRLSRDAGRDAIVKPVESWSTLVDAGGPVEVEPALVDVVLDEVGAGRIDPGLGGRGAAEDLAGPGIETPYLQLVMQRVWDEERAAGSRLLRLETFQRLGGARRIVAEHLERAIGALSPRQQDIAASVFHHLVTPSGTKVAHGVDDLANYADVSAEELGPILRQLADGRILRATARDERGGPQYEIFHDVLAGAVLGWRNRHEADRRVERERAQARRRHRIAIAVAATAVVALALVTAVALFAFAQRSEAREQTRSAQARELAASALSELQIDPELSLLLGSRAAGLEPSQRVEDVLRRALVESRVRDTRRLEEPLSGLGVTAAGAPVAAGDSALSVLDARLDPKRRLPLRGRLVEIRGETAITVDGRTVEVRDLASGDVIQRVRIGSRPLPVRDLDTGRVIRTLAPPRTVKELALEPNGTLLAVSSGDRRVVVLNAETGAARYELRQPSDVTALAVGPTGRTLAVGGKDGTVRLWNLASGNLRTVLRNGHKGPITDIAFSPRATIVATASTDGTGRLWRGTTGEAVAVLVGHTNFVTAVAFSPDGYWVITGSRDETARTWNADTGGSQSVLRGHTDAVTGVGFTRDSRHAVTASADGTVRLWDALAQPQLKVVARVDEAVSRARFAPGGIEVVTDDGRALLVDDSGKAISTRRADPEPPSRSVDGTTAEPDGAVVILRRPDGRTLTLEGHTGLVNSARFSPDGTLVVTASRDHTVRVWDAHRGGRSLRVLRAHFGEVLDASFSPDGRWIVTAGPITSALYPADSKQYLFLMGGHKGRLTSASFDATGTRVLTSGIDGTVRIYRCSFCVSGAELQAAVRKRLSATGRELTPDERARFGL